jgi:hypothetical protein
MLAPVMGYASLGGSRSATSDGPDLRPLRRRSLERARLASQHLSIGV